MKFYKYIVLLSVLVLASACAKEEFAQFPNEVQFGLSLNDANGTRTVYGPVSGTGYPLYWTEGDTVLVASPQCAVKSAKYKVTPESGQSYAKAMTKTGSAGLQWGATNAKFYSIYPAANMSWNAEGTVIANLNISSTQSANIVEDKTNSVWYAADMKNVIMYARTGEINRGETVNLKYIPYSTILEFEIELGPNKVEQAADTWGSAKVMSMTLTAPAGTPLAGDFSFEFTDRAPNVVPVGDNLSNTIKMDFKTQPVLDQNIKKLFVKFAVIPSLGIGSGEWTVDLEVLEGMDKETKTYTRSFAIEQSFNPGKIHRIKLPKISSTVAWNPDFSKWITQLYDYKNIYLTELSIPGAWYSLGKNEDAYQASNHTAATLWAAGVRAFAVECRTVTSGRYNGDNIVGVSVSGTQNQGGILGSGDWCYGGTRISSVISSIAQQVAGKNEFAVLVLSYADGGDGGHRSSDYNYFLKGISQEITQSGATNIYSKEITPLTTVNDVIGNLIIKVNVDDNITKSSYGDDMHALISYNPFLKQLPASTDYDEPLFSKMYWSNWNDTYKSIIGTLNSNDFFWCFSSANRTQPDPAAGQNAVDGLPTYKQRKAALVGMVQHSKEMSKKSNHNVWFYFNAGGTQTNSTTAGTTANGAKSFAKEMNPWLLDVINLKANGGQDTKGLFGTQGAIIESQPSPLGIVMFNQCTGSNDTYYGADIIRAIVMMNNKFDLRRDNTADGGGSGDGGMDENSINN